MKTRSLLAAAIAAASLLTMTGCAVTRGQETMGSYMDDSAITAAVKSRFVEDKNVDASAISVETLKGTVLLSGFAKNTLERTTAGTLAGKVKGVKAVKNEISVRP